MAIKNTIRRRSENEKAAPRGTKGDDLINFEPQRLLSGIVFHLLDEDLALEIDQPSLASLKSRLEASGVRASISRWTWQHMSDYDRLRWLLKTTAINVIHHDGVAKLW